MPAQRILFFAAADGEMVIEAPDIPRASEIWTVPAVVRRVAPERVVASQVVARPLPAEIRKVAPASVMVVPENEAA